MKKLLLTSFSLVSIYCYSQTELYGNWSLDCPIEYIDQASAKFCQLCPTAKKGSSSMEIKGFEIKMDKDQLTLNRDGKLTTVKYTWNSEINELAFIFNEQNYKFKMLLGGSKDLIILKNDDNLLLTLSLIK